MTRLITRFLFSTDPRPSPGDCLLVWFHNFGSGTDIQHRYPCSSGVIDPEYGLSGTNETLHTVIPNGVHAIWGTDMNTNQWQTGDYVFHPQTTPALVNGKCSGFGCPAFSPPHTPNWYWDIYPAVQGSNGGDLFDCSYDPPATTCNLGS